MGGGPNTISVRTKHDKEEDEHDKKLMERIMLENRNPFQQFVDPILGEASRVYNTYLYSAGVMFVMLSVWSFYPSFVRFRHQHIMRYRKTQLSLRRGLLVTPHLPKWDKKYLQRIVVPPLPTPTVGFESDVSRAAEGLSTDAASARVGAVAVVTQAEEALATVDSETAALYKATQLTSTQSAQSTFSRDDTAKSERALQRELQAVNRDIFGPKSHLFNAEINATAEDLDLQARLKEAVKAAKAVVVLKEDHITVHSIPEGWEVWWVSFSEAKRRRFCRFWLGGLLCARAFEDLMDMPDMPDMVN